MITSIGPITIAGVAAGVGLTLVQLVFGNELDAVESQAVGIVAAGGALTAYAASRGPAAHEMAAAYWMMAAVAGIPAVATYWARRRDESTRERARRGVTIAGRDYRGDLARPATTPATGHS